MSENLLYIADGDKESEEAIRVLNKCGITFKKIIVGKDGVGKSMWRDLRTTQLPTLHSPKGTFVGIKEIGQECIK